MIERGEKIQSVHIEKTAGRSLQQFYTDVFGAEQVLFYYNDHGGFYFAQNQNSLKSSTHLQTVKSAILNTSVGRTVYSKLKNTKLGNRCIDNNQGKRELPKNFAILHGHFRADQFDIPNSELVAVFREPLERIKSQHKYYKAMYEMGHDMPEWYDPKSSLVDFATSRHVKNLQSWYLSGKSLKEFRHVGVTERLDEYCEFFDPSDRIKMRRFNPTPRVNSEELSERERTTIQKDNADDIALYEAALSRVNKEARKRQTTYHQIKELNLSNI